MRLIGGHQRGLNHEGTRRVTGETGQGEGWSRFLAAEMPEQRRPSEHTPNIVPSGGGCFGRDEAAQKCLATLVADLSLCELVVGGVSGNPFDPRTSGWNRPRAKGRRNSPGPLLTLRHTRRPLRDVELFLMQQRVALHNHCFGRQFFQFLNPAAILRLEHLANFRMHAQHHIALLL